MRSDTIFAIILAGSVIIFRMKITVLIKSLKGRRRSVTGKKSIFRGNNTIFRGKNANLTMILKASLRGSKRIFIKMWSINLNGCMRQLEFSRLPLDNAV